MTTIIRHAAAVCFLLLPHVASASPPAVTLEQVKAALPALEKYAEQTQQKTGVPGMVIAVVFQDQLVYLKGFGVREAGKPALVDGDTVFQIASVSKPMATTVLAALVGAGVCRWDDPVTAHDPGFQLHAPWVTRAVSLRDLLCHRSGLPDHAGDLLEDMGYDRAAVLHRLRYMKPAYSFRAGYGYTNFGFTAAAAAAARTAGKSWEDLCAEKLYRPLGMQATSSRYADYAAAKNRARLHVRLNGKFAAQYERQPDAQAPAASVSTSGRDLAQWLRLQLADGKYAGKQVIPAAALAETHRPQVITRAPKDPATERAGFYGLGWNVGYDDQGRVRLSHSGAFDLGAATAVALLPAERLGILVLTNAAPVGVPEAITFTFFDQVSGGKPEKDWLALAGGVFEAMAAAARKDYSKPPAKPAPALAAAAYTGTFGNDVYGPIEVIDQAGLQLRLGPKKLTLPLRHWDRDTYLYQPVGEMAAGLSAVTFAIGTDGRAVSLVVENLDVSGQGTFQRVSAGK